MILHTETPFIAEKPLYTSVVTIATGYIRELRLQRHSRDSREQLNCSKCLGITLGATWTVSTANITWTQGAAPVVREAPEDTIRASQIVGAARITEALRAAERDRVNKRKLLRQILNCSSWISKGIYESVNKHYLINKIWNWSIPIHLYSDRYVKRGY